MIELSGTHSGISNDRLHFRPDIQGLRGIAVTVVMIFHIWPTYLSGGYIGVDAVSYTHLP